eukprot:GILI01000732.1.p1 GENE.GILI01000732.1~~GILI01000732.1.p1  ORF type:complete len:376 (+),score=47.89 GILI01000732.1:44-1171(+)
MKITVQYEPSPQNVEWFDVPGTIVHVNSSHEPGVAPLTFGHHALNPPANHSRVEGTLIPDGFTGNNIANNYPHAWSMYVSPEGNRLVDDLIPLPMKCSEARHCTDAGDSIMPDDFPYAEFHASQREKTGQLPVVFFSVKPDASSIDTLRERLQQSVREHLLVSLLCEEDGNPLARLQRFIYHTNPAELLDASVRGLCSQFATSPAFNHEGSRYGSTAFDVSLHDLLESYRQQRGIVEIQFKRFLTHHFTRESEFVVLVCGPQDGSVDLTLPAKRCSAALRQSLRIGDLPDLVPERTLSGECFVEWHYVSSAEYRHVLSNNLRTMGHIDSHPSGSPCRWDTLHLAFYLPNGPLQVDRDQVRRSDVEPEIGFKRNSN